MAANHTNNFDVFSCERADNYALKVKALFRMFRPQNVFKRISHSPLKELREGTLPFVFAFKSGTFKRQLSFSDIKAHIKESSKPWDEIERDVPIACFLVSSISDGVLSVTLNVSTKALLLESNYYEYETPEDNYSDDTKHCFLYINFTYDRLAQKIVMLDRGIHPLLQRKGIITEVSQQLLKPFLTFSLLPIELTSSDSIHPGTILYFVTDTEKRKSIKEIGLKLECLKIDLKNSYKKSFRAYELYCEQLLTVDGYERKLYQLLDGIPCFTAREELEGLLEIYSEDAQAKAYMLIDDVELSSEQKKQYCERIDRLFGAMKPLLHLKEKWALLQEKVREIESSIKQYERVLKPYKTKYTVDLESILSFHEKRLSSRFISYASLSAWSKPAPPSSVDTHLNSSVKLIST